MSKWIEGDRGEPIDVSTLEDEWTRYSMDKPEPQKMEVEPATVAVKVGRLEIRQKEGSIIPWNVEIFIDGERVKRVRSITLHIEYMTSPKVTIEHYV